jgi:hypothetical protein
LRELLATCAQTFRIEDAAHQLVCRGRRRTGERVRAAGAALIDKHEIVRVRNELHSSGHRRSEVGRALPWASREKQDRVAP